MEQISPFTNTGNPKPVTKARTGKKNIAPAGADVTCNIRPDTKKFWINLVDLARESAPDHLKGKLKSIGSVMNHIAENEVQISFGDLCTFFSSSFFHET